MKINIILSLLMTCACLANAPSDAMDSPFVDPEKSSTTVHPSFEEQVEKAAHFSQQRKAQGLLSKMVLGARNTECNRISGDEWIFFDDCSCGGSHKPDGQPSIKGDFNNLNHLFYVAIKFGPSLDLLLLDRATLHHTGWGGEHLQAFASMVPKPEGMFVVSLYFEHHTDITSMASTVEQAYNRLKEMNHLFPGTLPVRLKTPFIYNVSDEVIESDWVKEEVAKYDVLQPFLSLSEDDFIRKQRELGFTSTRPLNAFSDKEKFTRKIASEMVFSKAIECYKEDIVFPHMKAIFEQYFIDVQVCKGGKILPFLTSTDVLLAKHPKR